MLSHNHPIEDAPGAAGLTDGAAFGGAQQGQREVTAPRRGHAGSCVWGWVPQNYGQGHCSSLPLLHPAVPKHGSNTAHSSPRVSVADLKLGEREALTLLQIEHQTSRSWDFFLPDDSHRAEHPALATSHGIITAKSQQILFFRSNYCTARLGRQIPFLRKQPLSLGAEFLIQIIIKASAY